ncbi:uncharacterized protein EDB93DRAFT_517545 [Suillus bovinus]|uniref:uncharacterized protein n=1 Tax=Suillus bovinus TaxID=48563 RepID=UPI001B869887|nr:uncharacterized protein EDB93DRAFT_517545 [Suillus bovinus]KAG2145361.1 hypothetical protein EDB93DRAFT_517545 [Suillus bovinus]
MHVSALQLSVDMANTDVLIKIKYAYVALLTLWIYDYVITLDEELSFVKGSNWRVVKYLYLVCRYVPFFYLTVVSSPESILFVRTYAVWDRSKWVLWTFIISLLLSFLLNITPRQSSPIGSPPGWRAVPRRVKLLLYFMFANYRNERGAKVLRVLVQHNIFYFLCGVASSGILIIAIAIFPASYSDLVSSIQITVHAALVTRMHRTLWRYNADYAHPDEFSLTTFNAPPPFRSRTVQSAIVC